MSDSLQPASGSLSDASEKHGADAPSLMALGGILAALGATSCCILPLVLFALGISGAWIGNLTALAPYQPVFIGIGLLLLGLGFWRVYRRPVMVCANGSFCSRPSSSRITKAVLWIAAALIFAAVTFPYTAPLLI